MSPDEIKKRIVSMICVTSQQVTFAKAWMFKDLHSSPNSFSDAVGSIEKFLQTVQGKLPKVISVHSSVDTDALIKQAANAISWKLAGCEAIWGLISANLLIPFSQQFDSPKLNIGYTTDADSYGGSTLDLSHFTIRVPQLVKLAPSQSTQQNQPLSDPDLFLHELNIPNLHKEVEEALREAVRCFRHELYLACLGMLGRSSEGAWIELGLKLAKAVERHSLKDAEKIRKTQQDVFEGLGKKIMKTVQVYERVDLEDLRKQSGVTLQDIRNCVVWADVVRDSRNSVHYGAKPAMSNSYEKVAALLVGAVPHLRILYRIHDAVDVVVI